MVIRVGVAMLLGAILGIERFVAGKTAGMRTYALVSMGSAVFVITAHMVTNAYIGIIPIDPLRVMGNIVSGIGFIGAGIIIFRKAQVHGLTTAAGLWVASAIGISSGFGFFEVAVVTTTMTLFVFVILWFAKAKLSRFLKKYFPHIQDDYDEIF